MLGDPPAWFGGCVPGNATGMGDHLERERKWSVGADFRLPDAGDLAAHGDVSTDTVDLTSTYYDTADGDLLAHGIVMRRRDGDDDTGWQVKVPTGDGRLELHWPLADEPPGAMVRALWGVALGGALTETATIRTRRDRHQVTSEGVLRFEIADDHVRASVGDTLLAWREVEVELGPDVTAVPKKLRKRLRAAGAVPSTYPSKLAHAIGESPPVGRSDAGAALADYVTTQLDQVMLGDVNLRRGLDPIHDTRVAIRRLRSVIRVFGDVLDPAAAGLEPELKWFAALLGEVRDPQVQQERFIEALDDVPDELVLGPVRSRIRSDLAGLELPARRAVDDAMTSDRYRSMLAALRHWRDRSPVPVEPSARAFRALARKASRKADRRLATALDGDDPALLHRARKAAKRARYAAEAVTPIDSSAARTMKRHKVVQSVLGDHQDTVVARELLRRMGAAAGIAPRENGFTFGLLYAREERLAAECRVRVRVRR
ncbi:CYTH and CHAD domain-containing protein [Mycolicibacterium sediminis]|uniref:CHAD domain-containing protein n=1 Tax=Mycolicibacterium sediminis TaxID=1286180 RepID=A0A7I7QSR5_9MYCO|nr:CHAD domain-containing protein [Mycolicibacterium sediminis]